MNLIGNTTINPLVFYTGKFSGYFTWMVLVLAFFNVNLFCSNDYYYNKIFSIVLLTSGLIFTIISLINLGNSTRLGLPTEKTNFKTKGLYKISRNPMYVGFNLITISSIVYISHILIALLGVYSVIVYHLIILGEEKFLENRFGEDYENYKKNVRRYL